MTFTSVNFHSGNRLSRRDDLESLAYLLMYLINSSLPWTDTKVTCNDDILKLKMGVEATGFCDTLPSPCIISFLLYTRQLSFTQKPDYSYIFSLFRNFQSKVTPPATLLPPDLEIPQLYYWVEDITPVLPPCTETPRKRVCGTPCCPPLPKRYATIIVMMIGKRTHRSHR
jgi:hypothetical protein